MFLQEILSLISGFKCFFIKKTHIKGIKHILSDTATFRLDLTSTIFFIGQNPKVGNLINFFSVIVTFKVLVPIVLLSWASGGKLYNKKGEKILKKTQKTWTF